MSKKIIASVLAVAFAVSMAGPAGAVTVEELQQQIQDLLAQIALLQSQLSGQSATTTGLCLSSDLKFGMTSAEVKILQQGLNQDSRTQVAVSGAGAPGYETSYFGALTKAAVVKFQDLYAPEVLAPWGLTKGTGFVGSTTRAKFNALYCTPVVPTTTTTVAPEETTTTTTVAPAYGTLSVVSYPVSNPQTTLYGANTYETVAGQYKATGSDMTVKKVAVKISSSAASAFPWQAFSSISIWDGATKLAELPVTEANAIKNTFAQVYTFNLSGFDWVIPNGEQKVLTVKVTTVSSPVSAATSVTWTVSLLTDVVSTDTAGVTYSTVSGSAITTSSLTLSPAQSATITTTVASDNPLAGNVIGSTSATTKVDVLKFNVKVEDVNATFNSGTIKVTTDGTTVANSYVTSLELWDGSTLIAAAAPSGWSGNIGTSTWSNFTLPVSAGTTKTLTVKAVLAQLPSTYTNDGTGGYLKISTGPSLSGIDANSNVVTADGTGITGNNQYPFLTAPVFSFVSQSVTVKGSNSQTNPNDIGDTSITFSVTANGGDIYIPTKSTLGTALQETLTGGDATTTTSTTWSCVNPGENNTDSNYWRIPSGQTANCTFSTLVTNTGGTAGYFNVALGTITWATTATTTGAVAQTWGLTNIKTADFYLGN